MRHVVLSHYHPVRVLGASGYEGAEVIASDATRDMIAERGQQDMDSETGRFPRLFHGKETIPGLTWPHMTFHRRMTLWMGRREVQVIHIGRSHTAGDTVVWLPKERVLFAGDTVEFGATPYCGDARFGDWPATLDAIRALGAEELVPGRSRSLLNPADVEEGLAGTASFTSDLFGIAKRAAAGKDLHATCQEAMEAMRPKHGHWVIFEHCMPFDVSRAYDEAKGLDRPRIWTAGRGVEMWRAGGGPGDQVRRSARRLDGGVMNAVARAGLATGAGSSGGPPACRADQPLPPAVLRPDPCAGASSLRAALAVRQPRGCQGRFCRSWIAASLRSSQ